MRRVALAVAAVLCSCGPEQVRDSLEAHRRAVTFPDYFEAEIPPNIAPFDIKIIESGQKFRLRVSGKAGTAIDLSSASGKFRIPPDGWRALLKANAGADLTLDLYAKTDAGWTHFDPVRNRVAAEEIDPYLVYRYIPPIYDKWGRISIHQRDLRSFEDTTVFDNETAGNVCVNCHSFANHRTDRMLIHSRPSRPGQIPAMILVRNGRAEKVDTRVAGRGAASYPAWHPDGKLIAFSRNSLIQVFHTAGVEPREVIDRDSDLDLYDTEAGKSYTVPQISRPDRLESWPAWSPDGKYLYFSSAPQLSTNRSNPPPNWDTIQYDLVRVAFDAATGRWGEPETVVAAARIGRSISEPAVSPDGRYLMFTGHDHGSFPIFQPSADLYLVDLAAQPAAVRRLDEINSPRADSYHSWSSNGRWVIFSSKRDDGVFTRLYIAHFDGAGHFGKPFVLPQQDADFYRECVMAFNRPELVAEPVTVSAAELARAINSGTAAAPPTKGSDEPYNSAR